MSHEQALNTKEGRLLLERVRRACRALPETEEIVDGFGHTVMRVRGKSFIFIGGSVEHGPTLSIKATKEMQQFLVQQGGSFWKTPYIGQHGWVSTRGDDPDGWDELNALIAEGYCLAAPKTLARTIAAALGRS